MKKEYPMIELNTQSLLAAAALMDGPINVFGDHLQISNKAEYLAFRTFLKAEINALAAKQVEYRILTREYGGDSSAQCLRNYKRPKITALIALRKAGKVWSASEAQKARDVGYKSAEIAKAG
jgi:uncharacterized phage-like protein YoqJ